MQKTRGAALLAASFLAMSGLAACGDEGGEAESTSSTASPSAPEKESTSEASASGSESSEPSDSGSSGSEGDEEVAELPAAAKKQTKAGAIAFNEFYQQQLGEAMTSGNTATLKKYTHDCAVCDRIIKDTESDKARGVTMDRNPYSAHDATASVRDDGGMKVTLTVKSTGYREVLPDGSKGRSADETSYTLVTDTQWRSGHWVIRNTVITE